MSKPPRPILPISVTRPTPFTFDLGLLLANDPNPLSTPDTTTREAHLASAARDGAQALINQLLSTCAATSTPEGVSLALPSPTTALPREKPVPEESKKGAGAQKTRWAAFAARRGIRPKTREARRNLVFDEGRGEWRPRWGRGGANKDAEREWLVEVDARKEQQQRATEKKGEGAASVRSLSRRERLEAVRRNEKRRVRNLREAAEGAKMRKK